MPTACKNVSFNIRLLTNTQDFGSLWLLRNSLLIRPFNFLNALIKVFPFKIECVQTDNGLEFIKSFDDRKKGRFSLFEACLKELGITHKLIRPFTPRHNGKVERSHRKDNEYFYATHKFYSFDDFSKQLAVHLNRYNSFPMRPLAWKSPKQYVSDYLNLRLIHN